MFLPKRLVVILAADDAATVGRMAEDIDVEGLAALSVQWHPRYRRGLGAVTRSTKTTASHCEAGITRMPIGTPPLVVPSAT